MRANNYHMRVSGFDEDARRRVAEQALQPELSRLMRNFGRRTSSCAQWSPSQTPAERYTDGRPDPHGSPAGYSE